jgi:class 3 adenylate cyclase
VDKLLQRRLTLKPNRLTQGQIREVFNVSKSGLQPHHRISSHRGAKLWWVLVGIFSFFMLTLAVSVNAIWYIDAQRTLHSINEVNDEIFHKLTRTRQDVGLQASAVEIQTYMENRRDELDDQCQQTLLISTVASCAIILMGSLLFGKFAQTKTGLLIKTVKRSTQAVANLDFDTCENLLDAETGMVSNRESTIREVIEVRDSFEQLVNGLRSFAKYMDPYVVQLLVQSRRQATLGVARADVTVFFSDIANFTTIAEAIDPVVFMEFFSVYLEEMSRTASGLPEVQSRMGLVKGDVLAGNIGSTQRMKYGLVGDSVNLASRLEGLCGRYGVNILVEETSKMAPGVEEEFYLRPVDLVIVKGRTHPTELYEVVASKSDGPMAPTMGHELCAKYCNDFEHIQNLYRTRRFQDALLAMAEYEKSFSDNKAATSMRERCLAMIQNPPGENWMPAEKLNKKS